VPARKPAKVIIHFPQESDGPSSMSHYCELLSGGLRELGHDVSVVSKRGLLAAAKQGLRRVLLKKTPAIFSTWPELVRRHKKDPGAWFVNISQEYIPPFAASRSINIIHDLIQIEFPRSRFVGLFYRHALPRLARNAALNISVSNSTAAGLAAMKILSRVVYNEFTLRDPPEIESRPSRLRKYAACWVGNLAKHKNIGEYLALAAALPDKSFAAVMPGRDALLAAGVLSLPVNLKIFHSLNTADYDDLLAASGYLVSTSLAEGFGRPPADGALAGCDIVVTDIPIYRELYDGLAHFYEPGDIAALAAIVSAAPRNIGGAALRRFSAWKEQYRLIDVIDAAISSSG
jgi:glycosyltransferase involved in cell wall biosynthesis